MGEYRSRKGVCGGVGNGVEWRVGRGVRGVE